MKTPQVNPLFKKPDNVRYVDMAIWIDNHIYDHDCDWDTAFTYMYLLAYMLCSKAKYFTNLGDYDDFAYFLAYSTYVRYTTPGKKKVKSVLNYMKSIMYFRRLAYLRETYNEIIDPEFNQTWNTDKYIDNQITSIESSRRWDILSNSIKDVFKDLPRIIKRNIPNIYKENKVLYNDTYTSVLLSMLKSYTLEYESETNLRNRIDNLSNFDEMSFYKKHLTKEVVLWHLPDGMESVINLIINKVNIELVDTLHSLSDDIKVSDKDFNIISKYEDLPDERD